MAWGKQWCGCWSEPGAHWDNAEPRVGALDTASMGQGEALRVQVRGRACKGGSREGSTETGAQSRIGYAVIIGEGRLSRQHLVGEGVEVGMGSLWAPRASSL